MTVPIYLAEVAGAVVVRVIVAPTPTWPVEHLGGEWQPTGTNGVTYCGPGYVHDAKFPERFAPQWRAPTPDLETGEWSWYPKGSIVGHAGRLWKSTTDRNVWEPGVSAWHPEPAIDGVLPDWIQPTGAHDAWWLGAQVAHAGRRWESMIEANTTEPGTDERWWRDMDPPPAPTIAAWVRPTGAHDAYKKGAEVTHSVAAFPQFTVWRSKINANTTEPGTDGLFHRYWEPVG